MGLTDGALFRHFRSKEEIVDAAIDRVEELLFDGIPPSSEECDTLDGPVVVTARAALEKGKVEPVLAWVAPDDEAEIREAFARARSVRKGGKEARELADRWFFETVVRVHRAGEGAPFTGLKPAETPEPAIAAVDAVASGGDAKRVEELLVRAVREGLHAHNARLSAEKPPANDVAAGRRWVAAYVPFVHWAEGPIQTYLAEDHARLEELLARSVPSGGVLERGPFDAFRAGLLRHIAIEEKILFREARGARGGEPLELFRRLRIEHGALASLLVPTPTEWVIAVFRDVTERFAREKALRAQLKALEAKAGG